MTLASTANSAALQAWEPAVRSFEKADGEHRFRTMHEVMRPDRTEPTRTRVYPAKSAATKRVVTKAIRGLHFHHYGRSVTEDQIELDLVKYELPDGLIDSMNFDHRGEDVARWWWDDFLFEDYSSIWLIQFFEHCMFSALIKADGQD